MGHEMNKIPRKIYYVGSYRIKKISVSSDDDKKYIYLKMDRAGLQMCKNLLVHLIKIISLNRGNLFKFLLRTEHLFSSQLFSNL